ncbi:hypothetical protein B9T26_15435 [Acinetobacter sp. ANC 4169]|uniref:hypothetical protein n=1 Tax=Acinetobacter sp. ANC 4169 TaxID=1977879 RepID=UPI000A351836|nr:hypothetical protein [Acinetobacter sp. ANC 4169]OTG68456.1 hypothetical protein B9T26_15435 [Acinetobacter sp. ANC 4169]
MKKMLLAITTLMMGCPAFAATASSSIPMGIDVPKSCTFFDVSTGIIVPEDGSEATGNFKMSCNTGYSVYFTTNSSIASGTGSYVKSAQGTQIPTTTSVTLWGLQSVITSSWTYIDGPPVYIGPQSGNFKVKLNSPTTATTPAGIYTDTLNMTVTY